MKNKAEKRSNFISKAIFFLSFQNPTNGYQLLTVKNKPKRIKSREL